MEDILALRVARSAAIVLAVALLGAACAKPSAYIVPVTKFRNASAVVIESTQAYLTALNKTEREHYINDQVASHGPILLNRIEEVQVFGADAIAARLDALDQLADYTELLYRLATSDAPETIKGQARDLGTALSNLTGKVSGLTGADNAGFQKAAGTVFPILGKVLEAIVAQRIEDALKSAATTGAAPVNTLIEAIKVDAEVAFQRRRQSLSKRRSDAALAYNTEQAKGSAASAPTLRRLANVIAQTEDQWAAFQTARPVEGLDAMQRANLALEKFARTPRPRLTDIAVFSQAMEVFASAAERLGEGVKHLTELQEGGVQ
jgi:hypothetical protein